MKKLTNFRLVFVLISTLCTSMIQAQLPPLPVTTFPTTNPQVPGANAPEVAKTGKYAEYQSYCRQDNFEENQNLTEYQQKKRLNLLDKKLIADPENSFYLSALIKEYLQQKKIKLAEDFYNKNKDQLSPEDAIVWSAEFDMINKQYVTAVNKLDKFIITNPNSTKALLKLARLKKNLLIFSDAEEIYKDLEMKNKKNDYSLELCELFTLDSHHKDAENHCTRASRNHPENPTPEVYLGISFREREQYKQAEIHFNNSIRRRKTEFALTCLGELFYLQKDNKKTIEYLNQAVEVKKLSYRAQIGLALVQFEEKKYEVALESFKNACRLGQKDTAEMLKSHKTLESLKSPIAQNYFDEIQKCQK